MKHLKSYKLFEELDKKIKPYLNDILISLSDDDIKYRISDFIDLGIAEISIIIEDKSEVC
jgi:hypothetical protein